MIRSMTGYGRGEAAGPAGRITVEIRAVNHRYCEVVFRLPRPLLCLEERARGRVQEAVRRGRVEVFAEWQPSGLARPRVLVDRELALAYDTALKELSDVIGRKLELTADSLVRLPEVLILEQPEVPEGPLWETLAAALDAALSGLVAMREREGAALAADLALRLRRVEACVEAIAARAPAVVAGYRERLQRKLEALGEVPAVDPARLAQEVALFAERSDITEEVVRLRSHLAQFRRLLEGGPGGDGGAGGREPVGRQFDFLVQEMNREIGTVGAKAQDAVVAEQVVAVRSELEKIREQVQNIE